MLVWFTLRHKRPRKLTAGCSGMSQRYKKRTPQKNALLLTEPKLGARECQEYPTAVGARINLTLGVFAW